MIVVHGALAEQVRNTPSVWEKIVLMAGELVVQARDLAENGWIKHVQIRNAIKDTLLEGADEEALERMLDELLPFSGWLEFATDRALDWLPLERMLDHLLDLAIKAAYRGMKGGAAHANG